VASLAIGNPDYSQDRPAGGTNHPLIWVINRIIKMAGGLNTRNLITIVSVTVLVGAEILGAALALGWALGGIFELPDLWRQILIGLFLAAGVYAMYRFFRHAATIEPIVNR
jgi:hypothetical protein